MVKSPILEFSSGSIGSKGSVSIREKTEKERMNNRDR